MINERKQELLARARALASDKDKSTQKIIDAMATLEYPSRKLDVLANQSVKQDRIVT